MEKLNKEQVEEMLLIKFGGYKPIDRTAAMLSNDYDAAFGACLADQEEAMQNQMLYDSQPRE